MLQKDKKININMNKLIHLTLLAFFSLLATISHAETVTYYINDALGSPVAAMDSSGTVIWRESYNPFGEGRKKPSQNNNDVGFTGHQKDDATGLTYMQARYYDPTIGRFYGVDPAPFSNVQNFNRFAYANNNPYRYTDPTGKCPNCIAAAVGGAIGFLGSIAIQTFTGDGEINWGTVGAATLSGAAIGLTAGLAAPEVATLGFTGNEAAVAVGLQTAPVAAVGGAVTQVVDNLESGRPAEQGMLKAAAVSAGATVLGGALGDKLIGKLTNSNILGESGKLTGGKAMVELVGDVTQETIGQTASNACTGKDCE